ncbi:hypothetical protein GCM10023350_19660 [Nocardioides endophyticus]|uniref:Integrase n=1 Tax=Nocardioides endophyticus TaxID=1353775 RepID=A0ABP8YP65_9ACTN
MAARYCAFHTSGSRSQQTVDSKAAQQAQLGHANEDITLEHYTHKAKVAPDLTDYPEQFRPPRAPKT